MKTLWKHNTYTIIVIIIITKADFSLNGFYKILFYNFDKIVTTYCIQFSCHEPIHPSSKESICVHIISLVNYNIFLNK